MKITKALMVLAVLCIGLFSRPDADAAQRWVYQISGGGHIQRPIGLPGCGQEGRNCFQFQGNARMDIDGNVMGKLAWRRNDLQPEGTFVFADVEVISVTGGNRVLLCGPIRQSDIFSLEESPFAYGNICFQDNGEGANDPPDLVFGSKIVWSNADFGGCDYEFLKDCFIGSGTAVDGNFQIR